MLIVTENAKTRIIEIQSESEVMVEVGMLPAAEYDNFYMGPIEIAIKHEPFKIDVFMYERLT